MKSHDEIIELRLSLNFDNDLFYELLYKKIINSICVTAVK